MIGNPLDPSFDLAANLHEFVGLPCPECRRIMTGATTQQVWPTRWSSPAFNQSEIGNPLLPTIDHLVAVSRGGRLDDPHNVRVVCRDCNRRKGVKTHVAPFRDCGECRHPGAWHYWAEGEPNVVIFYCQACSLAKHREWFCGPFGRLGP